MEGCRLVERTSIALPLEVVPQKTSKRISQSDKFISFITQPPDFFNVDPATPKLNGHETPLLFPQAVYKNGNLVAPKSLP